MHFILVAAMMVLRSASLLSMGSIPAILRHTGQVSPSKQEQNSLVSTLILYFTTASTARHLL